MLWTWWLQEIQKSRIYSILSRFREPIVGEISTLPIDQAVEWTKERVYVYTDPVLCMWKTLDPEDAVKRWKGQVSTLQMFHPFREWQWRADCIRVEDTPRIHSFETSPKNSKRQWRTTHQIWKFQWSNNLHVHVFNDIDLDKKGNEDSCIINSRKIKMFASRFIDRHWVFLGPGEESKWYEGYAVNCGKCELRASPIVEEFENSGNPVFKGASPLGRGTLEMRSGRNTIHLHGEFDNIDFLFKTVNCPCGESALFLRSSHKAVRKAARGRFWKGKSGQTRKCSKNTQRNSDQAGRTQGHWLIFRDYRLLRETECSRTWKISNRCLSWAKFNLFEQRQNSSSNRDRKLLCDDSSWGWRMGKTHVNVQRVHSAQKSEGFKTIRIDRCKPKNWSELEHWNFLDCWCSRHWGASTITDWSVALHVDVGKSW